MPTKHSWSQMHLGDPAGTALPPSQRQAAYSANGLRHLIELLPIRWQPLQAPLDESPGRPQPQSTNFATSGQQSRALASQQCNVCQHNSVELRCCSRSSTACNSSDCPTHAPAVLERLDTQLVEHVGHCFAIHSAKVHPPPLARIAPGTVRPHPAGSNTPHNSHPAVVPHAGQFALR